jgi:hypothetical protein
MKYIKIIIPIIFLLFLQAVSHGQQINPPVKYKFYVVGQVFKDTLKSQFPPSLTVPLGIFNSNGNPVKYLGNKTYEVSLQPVGNPTGTFTFPIQYTETSTKVKYLTYTVQYLPSIVTTKTDYIDTEAGDTLVIDALANDVTTSSGLALTAISNVQLGEAWIDNGKIAYVAPSEFSLDAISYSVKDAVGTEAVGLIKIQNASMELVAYDTMRLTVPNVHFKEIRLPGNGFTLDNNDLPNLGLISSISTRAWKYKPIANAQGLDDFSFIDGDGHHIKVYIKVLNVAQNKSSVRDDKFYTSVNIALTFDVLANDLADHFPITSFSPELVHDTLGVFTFIPPTGFSGERNFTYTVSYGAGNTYTGKIKIYIGNYMPKEDLDYTFHTIKNREFVLEYNVPVSGYSFELVDAPEYGSVEIFNQSINLALSCDTITNSSIVVYTPDPGYYGLDSFSIKYCIADTCYTYKLTAITHDNIYDDCYCQGDDCVYAGDLNGDGRVSVTDIFAIGKYMGLSGTGRVDSLLPFWGGQYAADWSYDQDNGRNLKIVDANGDGSITKSDLDAIDTNYGNYHNLVPNEVLSVKDFLLYLVPNSTVLDSGDLLILDVYYGTEEKPVINGFGMAFELNLPPALVDSASVTGYFEEEGWFADGGNTLQLIKQPQDGRIQAGFTKAGLIVDDELDGFIPPSFGNQQYIVDDELDGFRLGATGHGKVGQFQLIVDDELDGFKSSDEFIYATIELMGAEMVSANGDKYTVPPSEITVKIRRNKEIVVSPTEDKLIIYPNPASTQIDLHFNGQNRIRGFKLMDIMGNVALDVPIYDSQHANIATSNLANGTYILQVATAKGVISKKIQVFNK